MVRPYVVLFGLAVLGGACSSDPEPASPSELDAGVDATARQDAVGEDTTTPDTEGLEEFDLGGVFAPCEESLELIVTSDNLGYRRAYARIMYEGSPAALLVDTGSQVTFLSAPDQPDGAPDVGEVDFGCGARGLLGRPFSVASEVVEAGIPVVGVVGADFFTSSPTRVDLAEATVTRAETIHPEASALLYEDVFGFMFVDVEIDDVPLKLGFDTGANHALWIGVGGQPGDTPVPSIDGYGDPITLYLGAGTLAWEGGPEAVVPVMRIEEHRSIEDSDAQIGIDAQGLFGLTTLPSDRFVIDGPNTTIWFEPRD